MGSLHLLQTRDWNTMNIFQRFFNYVMTWSKHRATVKALNRLTDNQLQDIGLSRYQINEMIWLEEDKQEAPAQGELPL